MSEPPKSGSADQINYESVKRHEARQGIADTMHKVQMRPAMGEQICGDARPERILNPASRPDAAFHSNRPLGQGASNREPANRPLGIYQVERPAFYEQSWHIQVGDIVRFVTGDGCEINGLVVGVNRNASAKAHPYYTTMNPFLDIVIASHGYNRDDGGQGATGSLRKDVPHYDALPENREAMFGWKRYPQVR